MPQVKTARLAAIGKDRKRRSASRNKRPIMQDEVTAEKLAADLKMVISDAEALLRATAGQAGETATAVRTKLLEGLDAAKTRLGPLTQEYAQQARAIDGYVRGNPWQAAGIAAVAGIVLGLLLSRR